MAKCAVCDKSIVLGGLKDGDVRYCSVACQLQYFFPKFQEALSRAAEANPDPFPAAAPGSTTGAAEPQPKKTNHETTKAWKRETRIAI